MKAKKITTKAELIRERDGASTTAMELRKLCERLIEKLKATRYASADDEAKEAERQIKKLCKGGLLALLFCAVPASAHIKESMIPRVHLMESTAQEISGGYSVNVTVQNDTEEHIKVLNAKVCNEYRCAETQFSGDFQPHTLTKSADATVHLVATPIRIVLVSVASKEERPKFAFERPTFDAAFALHSAALGGATAMDLITTSRFLNYSRGGGTTNACRESNFILGHNPSDGRLAARGAAIFFGQLTTAWMLKRATRHSAHRWLRESWRVPMLYWSGRHIEAGAVNLARCGS